MCKLMDWIRGIRPCKHLFKVDTETVRTISIWECGNEMSKTTSSKSKIKVTSEEKLEIKKFARKYFVEGGYEKVVHYLSPFDIEQILKLALKDGLSFTWETE